jgi:hypothetical protein
MALYNRNGQWGGIVPAFVEVGADPRVSPGVDLPIFSVAKYGVYYFEKIGTASTGWEMRWKGATTLSSGGGSISVQTPGLQGLSFGVKLSGQLTYTGGGAEVFPTCNDVVAGQGVQCIRTSTSENAVFGLSQNFVFYRRGSASPIDIEIMARIDGTTGLYKSEASASDGVLVEECGSVTKFAAGTVTSLGMITDGSMEFAAATRLEAWTL